MGGKRRSQQTGKYVNGYEEVKVNIECTGSNKKVSRREP